MLTLSTREVAQVFHLPLRAIIDPARLVPHPFRGRGTDTYWTIIVSDLVNPQHIHEGSSAGSPVAWNSELNQPDEVGGGREGTLEVWGLTGWYVNTLARALQLFV
jgi:hypothetical protein